MMSARQGCFAAVTAAVWAAAVAAEVPAHALFATSDNCVGCHNDLVTAHGEDVSIGHDWSASMMANSARDPYWQAAVRREVMDHPEAAEEIEDECSACHMPMARYAARAEGGHGRVFAHLPFGPNPAPRQALAEDGVSCAICHQIEAEGLGSPASFTGGFTVDETSPRGRRPVYGPFAVTAGHQTVMSSASLFRPERSTHVQSSELCATCHTLYTKSRGPAGDVIATLPEQMPYLEWRHSRYVGSESCQSCHMPVVGTPTPVTAVLGVPREGFSRHVFKGGNFFMLRMLGRYRDELAVRAPPAALNESARRTVAHLQSAAARLALEVRPAGERRIEAVVEVENLAGHKLPTAYPSRRTWLHLRVTAADGETVFESGRPERDGSIAGNDNDLDPRRYEPHHERIASADDVQVWEGILAGPDGQVTTGLLTAIRYVKDNRILPHGFDKTIAGPDIAVRGNAAEDPDFEGGGDRITYEVALGDHDGPFRVEASLWYQPIAYRWARNLAAYDAFETERFVRYYDSMAAESALRLVGAEAEWSGDGVRDTRPRAPNGG